MRNNWLVLVCIAGACATAVDAPLFDPPQACRDVADAFADLCERCDPGSYTECYDEYLKLVNGSCDNVVDILDGVLLYGSCIPYFEDLTCAELGVVSSLDSSCEGQLIIP